jgi:hypothetical protein
MWYGVAPHICYHKIGAPFGHSQPLPTDTWEMEGFVPEIETNETWEMIGYPNGCGVFYCTECQKDKREKAWDAVVAKHGLPPDFIAGEVINFEALS